MRVWVGIDDTDSGRGMCTTYVAKLAMERVEEIGEVIGLPRLIRLNPTIPFKTRGNGAVSFLAEVDDVGELVDVVNEVVLENAEMEDESTNPGVVFVSEEVAAKLGGFARKAIRDVVTMDEALFVIGKYMIPHVKYKKGRGLIGALAAVGAELDDYTLELLVYRFPERFGTKREYDEESFFEVDYLFYPKIFDTVDWCNNVVVAVPNTPCPVLYGLRGESVEVLHEAMRIVKTEPYDRYQLFVTNHATDMHIIDESEVNSLKNYRSYRLRGTVVEEPHDIEGGHVFFAIETRFGVVRCAAFEPTKQFRNFVRKLKRGDVVEVYGSMKRDTINLEKINVLKLAEVRVELNPRCPECGKRMESAGRGKGFRCRKCKTRSFEREIVTLPRDLDTGFYEVPPSARRHLSKPLIRMNVKRHVLR
ncbi:MAG: tRNA(Ile)(2)-agmatinylcytidine synthase [Archaeoglobaceae archaeon]